MIVLALVQANGMVSSLEVRLGASVLSLSPWWGWERAGAMAKARRGRMCVSFIFGRSGL